MPYEKHIPYFVVLEAIEKEKGCPLCALEKEELRHYFDTMLDDSVSDPSFRHELVKARGFCARHGDMLLDFRQGLGTAILYLDQVKLFLKEMNGTFSKIPSPFFGKKPEGWKSGRGCPACKMQIDARKRHISVFISGLGEKQMRSAYENSPGFCVPHLNEIFMYGRPGTETRNFIISVQQEKSRKLEAELEEFCRKKDYRFSGEEKGPEADSWKRAVKMMSGETSVF